MAAWSVIARLGNQQDRLGHALQQLARNQHCNRVQLPAHKVLAALLGTTRETVARTLARLRARKDLESAGHQQVQLGPRLALPELGRE
jgi:CRP-like cAMP-binding protein